jgi:hypothetical protein
MQITLINLNTKDMDAIWKDAYKMKCGEQNQNYPNTNLTERLVRVPGGWIYIYGDIRGVTSTFIPFDNEFQGLLNELKEK